MSTVNKKIHMCIYIINNKVLHFPVTISNLSHSYGICHHPILSPVSLFSMYDSIIPYNLINFHWIATNFSGKIFLCESVARVKKIIFNFLVIIFSMDGNI